MIKRREIPGRYAPGVEGLVVEGSGVSLGEAGDRPRTAGVSTSARRPMNLLFINTDQQRRDALSCAGNPHLSTPNLDRLAREGVRFSRAVTPSPQCVPARMGFHTGLSSYSHRWFGDGVTPAEEANLGAGTFSQILADHGYRAEFYGLWHGPESVEALGCYHNLVAARGAAFYGFQHGPSLVPDPGSASESGFTLGYTRGRPVRITNFVTEYRAYLRREVGEPPMPSSGQFVDVLSGWPYDPDPTDYNLRSSQGDIPGHAYAGIDYGVGLIPADYTLAAFKANQAIEALERLRDEPFALTVEFLNPHNPQYVSEPWASSIDPKKMPVPPTLDDKRVNTPYERYSWEYDAREKASIGLLTARYYQLVQEADYHIGRILDKLDKLGLAGNTLIVFTSDHGEMLGDHGLQQKGVPYKEALHSPLLMRLPGIIPAGRVVDSLVNLIDIPATVLDYLAVPIPPMEGRSLRPLVEGRAHQRRRFTISETGGTRGLWHCDYISDEWKFVWTPDPAMPDLLYDLAADPAETNNLIGWNPDRARYLPRAESIRREVLGWMEEIRHPFLDELAASELR